MINLIFKDKEIGEMITRDRTVKHDWEK